MSVVQSGLLGQNLPVGAAHYRAFVGPPDYYDVIGALQFNLLATLGLREHHILLDIGCGSLRGGRLFIPYLLPGHYYGLEPEAWLIEEGIRHELGEDLVRLKRPTFNHDSDFTLSLFGQQFDFLLAQSIFSHATSRQIERCLKEAKTVMRTTAVFAATFFEGPVNYTGAKWVYPGRVTYRLDFLQQLAETQGLKLEPIMWPHPSGQTWVLLAHAGQNLPIPKTSEFARTHLRQLPSQRSAEAYPVNSVTPKSFSSPAVIITGMHRSGTSLIANLLHQRGVNLGARLLEQDSSNPHGFYEDVDFYTFHQHALHTRGRTLLSGDDFVFEPTPTEVERAQALIEQRADQAVWGWKDPRTTLFLDFWHQLLPQARFLFVYRHPLEVLISLVRRGRDALPGLLEGLQTWCAYNTRLADFYERYPGACLLVHSHSAVNQVTNLGRLLQEKLGLVVTLDPIIRDEIYHPDEFQALPLTAEAEAILNATYPRALEVYVRLNTLADLPEESTSAPSGLRPEIVALSSFVSTLPNPQQAPLNRALLATLLASLAPSALEAFWRDYGQHVQTLERTNTWLEGQRATWQMLTAESERRLHEQRTWIDKLQEGKTWLEDQRAHWQTLAAEHERHLHEQHAWINKLQEGKTWLEGQRAHWQTLAAEHAGHLQEQRAWIEKLQEGKTWLEGQRTHWHRLASERQAQLTTLEQQQSLLQSRRLYRLLVRLKLLPQPTKRTPEAPPHA